MTNKELDIKLKEILKDLKPAWDGSAYNDIIRVKKAIKSKYNNVKLDVLNSFR